MDSGGRVSAKHWSEQVSHGTTLALFCPPLFVGVAGCGHQADPYLKYRSWRRRYHQTAGQHVAAAAAAVAAAAHDCAPASHILLLGYWGTLAAAGRRGNSRWSTVRPSSGCVPQSALQRYGWCPRGTPGCRRPALPCWRPSRQPRVPPALSQPDVCPTPREGATDTVL